MCRFINADSQLDCNSTQGYNLFAYCENNPIIYSDPTGHSLLAIIGLGLLLVGMVTGLTASVPVGNSNNIHYSTNKDPIDPRVPPNPESGYVPPKKNPNPGKVKNPNGAEKKDDHQIMEGCGFQITIKMADPGGLCNSQAEDMNIDILMGMSGHTIFLILTAILKT